MPSLTPARHRCAAKAYAIAEVAGLTTAALCTELAPNTEKLQIGYLSYDFFEHATMRLLAGVFERRDTNAFDIVLFSYGPCKEDDFTKRIAETGLPVIDIAALSDQAVAALIHDNKIDVLVDLKGYTTGSRLGITARRPAPIIVSWLGYPGSLGHGRLADYIIGDDIVTPAARADDFSERLALMPHTYQPNDDKRVIPSVPPGRQTVGLPEKGMVFCSFNQMMKLNPGMFDVWCRLLADTRDSVLWLLDPESDTAKSNLLRVAGRHGVAERLIFAPQASQVEHLTRLQLADIALDTYPCNSHTTASDALWAGVPLVTVMGDTFAGCVAASLLSAHGLGELVSTDINGYFEKIIGIAHDPDWLRRLKRQLIDRRASSPLFDTTRFTRDLEQLYRAIVSNERAGRPTRVVRSG